MPELPEVETYKRNLSSLILNKKIINLNLRVEKALKNATFNELNEAIRFNKISNILRVAKYLIFEINDYYLISHLRMEGKWNIYSGDEFSHINKNQIIADFEFEDGDKLTFLDFRKFATLDLVRKELLSDFFLQKKIAPEPWDLSFEIFKSKLSKSKKYIKTILLDQSVIAGIGNIYADEILYATKIHPLRTGESLNDDEIKDILKHSELILKKSIEEGGSSIRTYASVNGKVGNYQNFLKVHTKEGSACYDGKHFVKKIKVNGRGTYYCEGIQN